MVYGQLVQFSSKKTIKLKVTLEGGRVNRKNLNIVIPGMLDNLYLAKKSEIAKIH